MLTCPRLMTISYISHQPCQDGYIGLQSPLTWPTTEYPVAHWGILQRSGEATRCAQVFPGKNPLSPVSSGALSLLKMSLPFKSVVGHTAFQNSQIRSVSDPPLRRSLLQSLHVKHRNAHVSEKCPKSLSHLSLCATTILYSKTFNPTRKEGSRTVTSASAANCRAYKMMHAPHARYFLEVQGF